MRVLVTGGAGYIGSVLVPVLLEAGHEVTALDCLRFGGESLLGVWTHPHFRFFKGNVHWKGDRARALKGQEAVVHLAAYVGEVDCKLNAAQATQVNLAAACCLAEEALAAGVRQFLLASTCSNYGRVEGRAATEVDELRPLSLYAETKVAAEQCVGALGRTGFSVVVMRLATAYGLSPRMRFDTMLNDFAHKAVTERWLAVRSPQSWRPFVHVRDVARFVSLALESSLSGVYNVGGHNRAKLDLTERLRALLPDFEPELAQAETDLRDYQVDFSKAEAAGFQPVANPEWGLAEVVDALLSGVITDTHSKRYINA